MRAAGRRIFCCLPDQLGNDGQEAEGPSMWPGPEKEGILFPVITYCSIRLRTGRLLQLEFRFFQEVL